jgi:hypothetical protein
MRVPTQNQVRLQSGRLGDDVGRMREENTKSVVRHRRQRFGGIGAMAVRVIGACNPNAVAKGHGFVAQPMPTASVEQFCHPFGQAIGCFRVALYGEQGGNFGEVAKESFNGRKGSVPCRHIARQGNQMWAPLRHQRHRPAFFRPEAT